MAPPLQPWEINRVPQPREMPTREEQQSFKREDSSGKGTHPVKNENAPVKREQLPIKNEHQVIQNGNKSKRPIDDYIDLTNSDDEEFSYPARKIPRTQESGYNLSQASRNSQRTVVIDDDDEDDDVQFIGSSYALDDAPRELYGTWPTKVVGLQYYGGLASNGETVLLVREPSNQYDRNAIKVTNVFGMQIGHIPKQVASRLAKYLDDRSLTVEGQLAGGTGTYDVPIHIHLYGPIDRESQRQIGARLKRDGIPTAQLDLAERDREFRRQAELARAAGMSSVNSMGTFASGSSTGLSQLPYRRLEDIIAESGHELNSREIAGYSEKFGMSEEELAKLPKAEKPKRMITELLPYQSQGLAWLQAHENPELPKAGSGDAVQLWKMAKNGSYTNIATNFSTREVPRLARGGILADDMGLGKTIQIISLIAADLENIKDNEPRTTLIAAPLSLLSNWSGQIAQHVNPKKPLRVHTYHGTGKAKCKTPADFAKYDVILTTYGTIAAEWEPKTAEDKENFVRKTGIFSNNWRRIVLDEGHIIRNPIRKTAQSVYAIKATNKWCLTGTPIVNSLTDLCSILKFVGVSGGLEQLNVFNSVLTRPVKAQNETAITLLQAVMAQFTLRRKKSFEFVDIKLPKITHTVINIDFSTRERKIHEGLRVTAKDDLEEWQELRGGDAEERRLARKKYQHFFEVLLRLRQVCNHWKLCESRVTQLLEVLEKQKSVEFTPENVKALKDMIKLAIESEDDCPICMDAVTLNKTPVITSCGHIFCKDDICQVIRVQGKCPMCRQELHSEEQLVELTAADYDKEEKLAITGSEENEEEEENQNSSKLESLMELLQSKQDEDNPKIVLFSQWTSFLSLVEPRLRDHGLKFVRLDGTMRVNERDVALKTFDTDPDCTILLASLAVASVGLNLAVANTVILSDSWWAPAIEDQAIDRIHRLGQKRECSVFKLIVADSVEQKVLQIQDEKRKLVRAAFNENENQDPTQRAENRLRDLRRLVG